MQVFDGVCKKCRCKVIYKCCPPPGCFSCVDELESQCKVAYIYIYILIENPRPAAQLLSDLEDDHSELLS